MIVMRSVTLGFALALGAAGAHAQSVVTRQVDNEPVETTVTQTPSGTVVTRRPLGAAPADTTYVDETVGAAPETRTTTRTTRRVVHHARHATTERTVTRTVHATRRIAAARPLVLAPAQRQVIYRTLVQQQVVRQAVPVQVVPSVPGYPPFPPPAYQERTVVVAPATTTGYGMSGPAEVVDDDDEYAGAPVAAAQVYPRQAYPGEVYQGQAYQRQAYPGQIYRVGSVLPASVAVAPLPANAAVAVPAARLYSYATVDGRVLLVDPVSNTVVADITP